MLISACFIIHSIVKSIFNVNIRQLCLHACTIVNDDLTVSKLAFSLSVIQGR